MNIHFVGFGNLAKAIAKRLPPPLFNLSASFPSAKKTSTDDKIRCYASNVLDYSAFDMVILAVKPQQIKEVWLEIEPRLPKDLLIVSLIAGIDTLWYQSHSHLIHPIIRAMPNTAVKIGQGSTPLYANAAVEKKHKTCALYLFEQLGYCDFIENEHEMDVLTALNGSGPAFLLTFLDHMIESAIALGLPRQRAKDFALAMSKGTLALANETPEDLSMLIKAITSKGGTTEAGLGVFNSYKFGKLIYETLKKATERAHELRSLQ